VSPSRPSQGRSQGRTLVPGLPTSARNGLALRLAEVSGKNYIFQQSEHPSTDEQIRKILSTQTVEY
jgi:hypothetical protein